MYPIVDSTPLVLFVVVMLVMALAILAILVRLFGGWVKAPILEGDIPETPRPNNARSVHHGALFVFHTDMVHELEYTNHRGRKSIRRIVPKVLCYGSSEWHREPQWLVEAFDVEEGTILTFALNSFG
jgi:hypothetical protein